MKKYFMTIVLACMSVGMMAQDVIQLPAPDKQVDMSLYTALQRRHSVRTYQQREVTDATLAQVLWAACGYNREAEKKITAASAINAQDIVVFVVRKDGAYRFSPDNNTLRKVSSKDLRPLVAGRQAAVASAPVMLVLASDQSKFGGREGGQRMGLLDAGYVSQNIYLACTALGLGTVARATMESDQLAKEMQLGEGFMLALNHPIGWE